MLTIFSTSAGPGTVCLHVTSGSSLKRNKRLKVVALGKQWNTILERVEETEGKLRWPEGGGEVSCEGPETTPPCARRAPLQP